MKRHITTIALSVMVLLNSLSISGESSACRIHPYVFTESTGDNQFVVFNKELKPIRAFSKDSNVEAVNALRSLKASIIYPNADGTKIFLQGAFHENDNSYRLDHWFIISPFSSYEIVDEKKLPQEIKSIERTELTTSDFAGPVINPAQYVRPYAEIARRVDQRSK